MNRTDRLLAIILELQDRKHLRAEDLAAIFEVSKRTVYRDIQALCEAGVPVVAVTGQGYSLLEGYFLPPVSFSLDEALLLILGSEVMAQNFDAQYQSAAWSARRKIEAVLPEARREQVKTLQQRISFVAAGSADSPISHEYLPQLRRAILERRTVRLYYHQRIPDAGESPHTIREVDPQRLVHRANAWYLSAYCHLRQEMRHFRLDRIERLELLPQTFVGSTWPKRREILSRWNWGVKTGLLSAPPVQGVITLLIYFGGSERTNSRPRLAQFFKSSSASKPSGST